MAINWQIALKLETLLRKEYGIDCIKTRRVRDQLMTNEARAQVANRAGAALLLRLHCDTGPNHGFTVYYPNRKGEHDGRVGPKVAIIKASRRAALAVHKGMVPALAGKLRDRGIMGEDRTHVGHQQGALTGSIFSEVPAVTVEMVFLSNRKDARFIKGKSGQQSMTRALADGVALFVQGAQKR